MYKVVVSDLDGTLLNNHHQISPHTRRTLHALTARGIRFVVATGRHHIDVQSIRDALGLDIYLITANGAVVHDPQDHCIYNQTIPAALAQELVEVERHPDIALHVYQGDEWLVEAESPELLAYHKDSGFSYRVKDLVACDKQQINKIFFVGEHEDLLELEHRLLSYYGDRLSIAFSTPTCLETMQKGVNKGNAVKAVLEQNGYHLADAIAFGDGMNDREMLTMVGRGVVMGNAHSRLKDALPDHPRALTNDEDGVADYLLQLFGKSA
ncbi:Cof-type HAD-IIB family hydrolase [Pseudaeromonas sharmana]|uniref:Cof-type HAD-IIB family hydrolase n=1 Tax=Pseudaeromonas sharmana TaxID=328412 RepID=A0ABV8CLI9_9GAMM